MTFPVLFHPEPAQMLALGRYEVARRAVAEARAVDDLVEVLGRAHAVHAYARQAKDRQMEIDAAEIRIRAERRLGELMAFQKATVGMAKNAPGPGRGKVGVSSTPAFDGPPTLAEAGIDKNLAKRARSYAAVPQEKFEQLLTDKRQGENRRVVLDPDREVAGPTFESDRRKPADLAAENDRLNREVARLRQRLATLKVSEETWMQRALAAGWTEQAA
ncbi:hypothetical protein [Reyranella sp.]|uniref:hypothetical protein n=1 Tax=Reyranella sp. TaxID=1929291 RepID=UPI003D10EE2E